VGEIIKDDARQYFSSWILLLALSSVSLMLCLPALHAGFYVMALKRFDGEKLESGDFVSGFQFFGRALALYAAVLLIGLPGGILATVGSAMLIVAPPEGSAARNILMLSSWLFWLAAGPVMALPGAAAFFAMPLIIDRDMGAIEALKASWAVTRCSYVSYLGNDARAFTPVGSGRAAVLDRRGVHAGHPARGTGLCVQVPLPLRRVAGGGRRPGCV